MAERVLTEVCLRDVEDADLGWFFEHQADEAAAQLVGFKTRDQDAFAAHWAKSRADESVLLQNGAGGWQRRGSRRQLGAGWDDAWSATGSVVSTGAAESRRGR